MNPTVGAIQDNAQQIIDVIRQKQNTHDLIIFPELCLSGYPPEDLLFRKKFQHHIEYYLQKIQDNTHACYVVVGHPAYHNEQCFNSLSVFYQGQCVRYYHKHHLPNYHVFDEARYFTAGTLDACILSIKEHRIGLLICEDLWQPGPANHLIAAGATTIVTLNASPFDYTKYDTRLALLQQYAQQGVNIIYVNLVGGQDELLFDGQSLAVDKQGIVRARAAAFNEELTTITLATDSIQGPITPLLSKEELIYQALVFGTKEYVQKNKFPGVLLGLSGGIDSALTLAIAVDALGADKVHAVMMPSRFSASISHEDALTQIQTLNVPYSTLSIEPMVCATNETLAEEFKGLPIDITEENIQARARGILLMALSNKTGKMVLTTSNKSESAVGYATLYGDMAGGFAVLKDVLKTQVYALAHFRNSVSPVIPQRVITRPPSAELREDQKDQDSLPDYTVLDAIISHYVERHGDSEELIQQGFDSIIVDKIMRLIQRNEYKRRQSAPGIRVSPLAFGKDWRYPITNGFTQDKCI